MGGAGSDSDSIAINEVELLLAEERTALSVMRTGIAILVLPLSVVSLLVATSRFYDSLNVLHYLIPLGVVCLALVLLGGHLVIHAIIRIRRYDRLIHKVKMEHSAIAEFLEPRG